MVPKSLDEKVWKVQQSSRTLHFCLVKWLFGRKSKGPEWTREASQIFLLVPLCIFVGEYFPRKPFIGSSVQLSSSLIALSSLAFEA